MSRSIFLICPVRNLSEDVKARIASYVRGLEAAGCSVHWPPRDTDQDDPTGMRICRDNGTAIFGSEEVHVWYDPSSQGSVFDLGMTFILTEVLGLPKKVVIANPDDVDPDEGRKSFPNVLRALAARTP